MESLDRILRRMIVEAYPELRRLRIGVGYQALPAGLLLRYEWEPGTYFIAVAEELRGAQVRVIEGGLAHELAHLSRDSRLSPPLLERAVERYERSRFYRLRDERATDALACDRGFGPQLLALVRLAGSQGLRFHAEHGLTFREIAARRRGGR